MAKTFKAGDWVQATVGTNAAISGQVSLVGTYGLYVNIETAAGVPVETYLRFTDWEFEAAEPPTPTSTNADILNGLKVGGVFAYGGCDKYVKVGSKAFVNHHGGNDPSSRIGTDLYRTYLFGVSDFPETFKAVEVTE